MDIRKNNAFKSTKSNICRCCLQPGCFKSFSEEYYYLGQKEVYEEMLKTTFDIRLPHKSINPIIHLVCEDCITKLRDATIFKQMVLQNEKQYLQIIKSVQFDDEGDTKQIVKLEDIKCESSSNLMDFGDDSFDEDDEILANIKKELETDLGSVQKKDYVLNDETKLKKCKIKTDRAFLETIKKEARVLPLYEEKIHKYKYTKGYSLINNEMLKCRWAEFVKDTKPTILFFFPSAKDLHLIHGSVLLEPKETVNNRENHRFHLRVGPGIDKFGQLPIPYEIMQRGR